MRLEPDDTLNTGRPFCDIPQSAMSAYDTRTDMAGIFFHRFVNDILKHCSFQIFWYIQSLTEEYWP